MGDLQQGLHVPLRCPPEIVGPHFLTVFLGYFPRVQECVYPQVVVEVGNSGGGVRRHGHSAVLVLGDGGGLDGIAGAVRQPEHQHVPGLHRPAGREHHRPGGLIHHRAAVLDLPDALSQDTKALVLICQHRPAREVLRRLGNGLPVDFRIGQGGVCIAESLAGAVHQNRGKNKLFRKTRRRGCGKGSPIRKDLRGDGKGLHNSSPVPGVQEAHRQGTSPVGSHLRPDGPAFHRHAPDGPEFGAFGVIGRGDRWIDGTAAKTTGTAVMTRRRGFAGLSEQWRGPLLFDRPGPA